ncbi:nuclear factor related to kappa-B-binding protein [Artemisia annua]|uniref:Nuclear factor related to kappa-B-binding protein n=1 Tax=Artemisia annua TaxID=35608 RepID=A0A2U1NN96_ARTAN|nr:nuclear factor related to kappa-B-binding protein [Artemisia annua]
MGMRGKALERFERLDEKSSISVEWDDKKKHVVPKKEQISIACRDLTPFLPNVPHRQNVPGDVFAAPSELFELNDLTGLLLYEVWQTQLSVQEREFLTQFLPEGADPHTANRGRSRGSLKYPRYYLLV